MTVIEQSFGKYKDQEYKEIIFDLGEISYSFTNLGARINQINLSNIGNILIGCKSASEVFSLKAYYFGAVIGRNSGRIRDAKFNINGREIYLEKNDGNNNLHSGSDGYDLKKWNYYYEKYLEGYKITFEYEDTGQYFPGTVDVRVCYLMSKNSLTIEYEASTDQLTIFNPTNHMYFNLNANNNSTILNHKIFISSDFIVPVDENTLPLKEFENGKKTKLNFKKGVLLKDLINSNFNQVKRVSNGIDHAFVLDKELKYQAKLDNGSIQVAMTTDQNAVVVYSLNKIKDKDKILKHSGITLETQKLPDFMNYSELKKDYLKPLEKYYSQTKFEITY